MRPNTSVASISPTPIVLTNQDYERLKALVDRELDGLHFRAAELLELELDRATVVSQTELPAHVVTMRSRVIFEDVATGKKREAQLVYPEEADVSATRISVLAPIGIALIGLSVGQTIEWPGPNGQSKTLRVVSVTYQPESAGDLHL